MLCFFGLIWGFVLVVSGDSDRSSGGLLKQNEVREYQVTENDTLTYTLKLAFNEKGEPAYFFRNIFTPVCITGECKPVYINFYWDLLGNYQRYDFPPREILTKMDHREFKPEDYQKLQAILFNKQSLLGEYAIEDLIGKGSEKLADSVDAKTGATLKTIKNEVIEGAVYTCYTLWHIAHGKKVISEMQKITTTLQSDALLHRFLASDNYYYQYWAIAKIVDPTGEVPSQFTDELLSLVRGKNVFVARHVLEAVSPKTLASKPRQTWLVETYRAGSYSLQLAILKKAGTLAVQPELAIALSDQLGAASVEQTGLIAGILSGSGNIKGKARANLVALLNDGNSEKSAVAYSTLKLIRQPDVQTQKAIKNYESKL